LVTPPLPNIEILVNKETDEPSEDKDDVNIEPLEINKETDQPSEDKDDVDIEPVDVTKETDQPSYDKDDVEMEPVDCHQASEDEDDDDVEPFVCADTKKHTATLLGIHESSLCCTTGLRFDGIKCAIFGVLFVHTVLDSITKTFLERILHICIML
jgi:hypothetical protein